MFNCFPLVAEVYEGVGLCRCYLQNHRKFSQERAFGCFGKGKLWCNTAHLNMRQKVLSEVFKKREKNEVTVQMFKFQRIKNQEAR